MGGKILLDERSRDTSEDRRRFLAASLSKVVGRLFDDLRSQAAEGIRQSYRRVADECSRIRAVWDETQRETVEEEGEAPDWSALLAEVEDQRREVARWD